MTYSHLNESASPTKICLEFTRGDTVALEMKSIGYNSSTSSSYIITTYCIIVCYYKVNFCVFVVNTPLLPTINHIFFNSLWTKQGGNGQDYLSWSIINNQPNHSPYGILQTTASKVLYRTFYGISDKKPTTSYQQLIKQTGWG